MEESFDDEIKCKICHETSAEENLCSPCKCKGSLKFIHNSCLLQWIKTDKSPKCEICLHTFKFEKIFAENTPNRIPLRVILSDIARTTSHLSKYVGMWTIFLLKILLVVSTNYYSLSTIGNSSGRMFFSLVLIAVNALHLQLYKTIVQAVASENIRINPAQIMHEMNQRANSPPSILDDDSVSDTNSEELVQVTNISMGSVIGSAVYNDFNLASEIKFTLSTSGLALITLIIRMTNISKTLALICKIFTCCGNGFRRTCNLIDGVLESDTAIKFYNILIKAKEFVAEFLLFIRIQSLDLQLVFIVEYIMLWSVVTLALRYFRGKTRNLVVRNCYFFSKVYTYFIAFFASQFVFSGILLHFLLVKFNCYTQYDLSKTSFVNAHHSISFMFHLFLGLGCISILKQVQIYFTKCLRPGLFLFDQTTPSNRSVKETIRLKLKPYLINISTLIGASIGLFYFLLYDCPFYTYSTLLERYVLFICGFSIVKNVNTCVIRLCHIYFAITRFVSSKFNLDNYLFNKKMLSIDLSRLVWDSNKNQNLEKVIKYANRRAKVDVQLDPESFMLTRKLLRHLEKASRIKKCHTEKMVLASPTTVTTPPACSEGSAFAQYMSLRLPSDINCHESIMMHRDINNTQTNFELKNQEVNTTPQSSSDGNFQTTNIQLPSKDVDLNTTSGMGRLHPNLRSKTRESDSHIISSNSGLISKISMSIGSNPIRAIGNSNTIIDTRRFLKYFGRTHNKKLSIFYRPKYTNLAILFIKALCVIFTKLLFFTVLNVSKYISQQFEEYLPKKIVFLIVVNLIVKTLAIRSISIRVSMVKLYFVFISPLICTIFFLLINRSIISSTKMFVFISSVCDVTCSIVKIELPSETNVSTVTSMKIIFLLFLANMTLLILYMTKVASLFIFVGKIILCSVVFHKMLFVFYQLISGNYYLRLKERYYLKETKVVDYMDAK